MKKLLLLFITFILFSQTIFAVEEAICVLSGTSHSPETSGTITFKAIDEETVEISGEIKGLAPNSVHGIHIHEV